MIDDQSDYFAIESNVWLDESERRALAERQAALEQAEGQRDSCITVAVDLMGRKVGLGPIHTRRVLSRALCYLIGGRGRTFIMQKLSRWCSGLCIRTLEIALALLLCFRPEGRFGCLRAASVFVARQVVLNSQEDRECALGRPGSMGFHFGESETERLRRRMAEAAEATAEEIPQVR